MKGNAVVGNAFICDRSSAQVIAECEKQLEKIEIESAHICTTKTAQELWNVQIGERKAYFDKLALQMRNTLQVESYLMQAADAGRL